MLCAGADADADIILLGSVLFGLRLGAGALSEHHRLLRVRLHGTLSSPLPHKLLSPEGWPYAVYWCRADGLS